MSHYGSEEDHHSGMSDGGEDVGHHISPGEVLASVSSPVGEGGRGFGTGERSATTLPHVLGPVAAQMEPDHPTGFGPDRYVAT